MVSSKALMSELERNFRKLQNQLLDVNTYAHPLSDVVFDLMTIETGIAGIVTRLLDGQAIPSAHVLILQKPVPIEEHIWKPDDGVSMDLEDRPEIVQYARILEQTREAALKVVNTFSHQ
jgi:hypothetical protein